MLSDSTDHSDSDAVHLELFSNRFTAIASEMGAMLQRTALSTNVKERQDFSCALLDSQGSLIVNAPHIPVHLGALGLCLRRVRQRLTFAPGDTVVTNHPAYGGSHLPDITVITPVFEHSEPGRALGSVCGADQPDSHGGTQGTRSAGRAQIQVSVSEREP